MNVFDLVAKINLDATQFKSQLDGVKGELQKVTGPVTNGLKTMGKAFGVAVGAAAVGIAGLTKQAVSAYGEYEQLVGGAQKIFDQMDYKKIEKDAQEAYKTMNLSAAEYLNMMNSVGATFSATMGDEKGYETAKTGMQAIADYASGTGRSVSELNEKFTLITRSTSSYQSIADQFSGILPATSKDFLAQAKAAGYLSAQYTELTQVPIAEYQQAVSKMLQKGVHDLGLTNNAFNESEKTITGSLAAMRSAWSNLVTGLADPNANIGTLIETFVGTAKNALKNLAPAIKTSIKSIAKMVREVAPIIANELPQLMKDILPDLISAAITLVSAFIKELPSILSAIGKAIPEIMNQIFSSIESILPDSLIPVFEKLKETIGGVVDWLKNLDESQINTIITIAEVIAATLGVVMAIQSVISVVSGVTSAIAFLTSPVGLAVAAIATLVAIGIELYKNWDTVKAKAEVIKEAVVGAWDSIKQKISTAIESIKTKIESLKQKFEDAKTKITEIVDKLKGIFNFEWKMPSIKLPHFTWSWNDLGIIKIPNISVQWYKKAYDNPYMFDKPTLAGFGDGIGREMVYGHQSLLNDIKSAMSSVMGDTEEPVPIVVQCVLDGRVIAENTTKWQRRQARAYG